ncbi:efflux RND transporter permease subunit [Uliginosibacterium gangwonense]|uniref:efflux RND transporter permease subunit n=1 Tax=Uliginosibacterium gangwonense TaxID=392736 RepID=UPI000370BD61|nr:efflux RND transporter permease subunit [Uliginosibacterium gangwonense]
MWFTRVSITNPVFAAMMMLALLVLGAFSYKRLAVEELPDVKFPIVVIVTTYPGASSEVVETDISRKIEEGVSSISGLKNLYSYSYQGRSVVVTEFELTVNPEIAVQDVREKIAAIKSGFRKEVDEPTISRYNPDESPIVTVAITSNKMSMRDLTNRADQYIRKQYQTLTGVGQVTLIGGTKREVQIQLDPDAMRSFGVGADQVIAALKQENLELPAGSIVVRAVEQQVQIKGRLPTPKGFESIVVSKRGNATVLLGQIAKVVDGEAERESVSIVNGKPALTLDIVKIQGGNTIAVADLVRARTAQLSTELAREDIHLSILNDSSSGVRNSLKNVQENLFEGALLTVLIVFLFLGSWRSTLITGMTLPVALLGSFYFLYIAGFTINVMTLMALSLCIGLLIDDAIVVRENIVRHAAMGKSAYDAAMDGTREIGLAVFATTMSIVAVFLPVGFMGGIIGKFFFAFGLTVAAAVIISMFVSFTLDPMLSSVWPDPDVHSHSRRGPLGKMLNAFEQMIDWLSDNYAKLIGWSLHHRIAVVLIATLSLVGALALAGVVGGEFVPEADMSRLQVRFDAPDGASLDYTEAKARQVEAAIHEFPEVTETYVSVNVGSAQGKNAAVIAITFKPRKERQRSVLMLTPLLRERIQRVAGITLKSIVVPSGPGGGQKPIYLSIQGSDFRELQRIAKDVTTKIAKVPGVVDLDTSLRAVKPTLAVELNRNVAGQVGLSLGSLGNALRPLIAGEAATTWLSPEGENYDVKVRLPEDERNSKAALEQLPFASSMTDGSTGRAVMIPLGQVATITETTSPSQINRRSLFREVSVSASLSGRPLGEVSKEIDKILAEEKLPPGYRFDVAGNSRDMAESAGYAGAALLLAILFIYMVLASQFGSFIQPLSIMSSLPLSLIGVMLALLISGSTLNIFSVIGIIMLMGLVTKNAILLIDFVNNARKQGLGRAEAIAEAGRIRLRPILMTTFAMVFGMLPLAFSVGEGSEQRAPMAHAIIGGVIASTLLTLVVVPVLFSWLDDFTVWFKHLLRGKSKPST